MQKPLSCPALFTLVLSAVLLLPGCPLGPGPEGPVGEVVLLSYNVCNLFDDREDGTEYPEFVPGGAWTSGDYRRRLEAVGKVIRETVPGGPDFVALMEVENSRVLTDLRNGPLRSLGYRVILTPPPEGLAVRVGVLTRLPVAEARSHLPAQAGHRQRPILEVRLEREGTGLTVFVCHFKSKTQGAAKTEESRVLAAAAVGKRMAELLREDPGADIVVLGDLNENADEYARTGGAYATALMPPGAAHPVRGFLVTGIPPPLPPEGGKVLLYSPWLDDPPAPGSYLHRGVWETIDHALLSPGLFDPRGAFFRRFSVGGPDFLFQDDGSPNRDYSDHLPLTVTLDWGEAPSAAGRR